MKRGFQQSNLWRMGALTAIGLMLSMVYSAHVRAESYSYDDCGTMSKLVCNDATLTEYIDNGGPLRTAREFTGSDGVQPQEMHLIVSATFSGRREHLDKLAYNYRSHIGLISAYLPVGFVKGRAV